MKIILGALLSIIAAYLIGSVNFAVIFSTVFTGKDPRNFGSKNAGATNALRVAGKKSGILTFLCDAAKGAIAALLGVLVFKYFVILPELQSELSPACGGFICGLSCIIGHCWPVFFSFKGGKAVASGFGVFAVCCPTAIILGFVLFVISLLISKIVSLSSLIATATTIVCVVVVTIMGFYGSMAVLPVCICSLVAGVIIFFRHSSNIERLSKGTESQIKG